MVNSNRDMPENSFLKFFDAEVPFLTIVGKTSIPAFLTFILFGVGVYAYFLLRQTGL